MQITAELTVLEVEGKDTPYPKPTMKVHSHWNHNGVLGHIVVETPEGRRYTVSSRAMDKAIKACTGLS